jgi:hypothetical protein
MKMITYVSTKRATMGHGQGRDRRSKGKMKQGKEQGINDECERN